MPSIDWDKFGTFVENVGVPFACLLLFVGPFVWLIYRIGSKYGTAIAQAHLEFMVSATKTQEQNAEVLAKLEKTTASDLADTHTAISLVAQAGIDHIDGLTDSAKDRLNQVTTVLKKRRS